MRKKIVFLSSTRADYGKVKPLMDKVEESVEFECDIFITGMHMLAKYGSTYDEIDKGGFKNTYKYINHSTATRADIILSNTILGFSNYVQEIKPDMIIVHGDRVEPLAGAIVGTFNNILVAHVEGGEISGTVDEILRHTITKLSHLHFVANEDARRRVIQLGEKKESIFVIGSPDIDIMYSEQLPSITEVKRYYDIKFDKYAIFMQHPVTTELNSLAVDIEQVVSSILSSNKNYVVIYPNNDEGSDIILSEYERFNGVERVKVFPSIRFEYFLPMLKNAQFIIGNSSAGIREAMVYGVPSVNIGTRQNNRLLTFEASNVFNVEAATDSILELLRNLNGARHKPISFFGNGHSADAFYDIISKKETWEIGNQKEFVDVSDHSLLSRRCLELI